MQVVKTQFIPGMENEEIKVTDDYKMNVPPELPQGFFSLLSVGSSGSGKTNATLNLIKKLKPYYNRYILISPTGTYDVERGKRAEKKYDKLKIEWDEEHSHYHRGLIKQILDRQRDKLIEYEDWKEYAEVWRRFQKFMQENKAEANLSVDMWSTLPEEDIASLIAHEFTVPDDPHMFPTQIAPTAMLVIDDMASTPIYNHHSLSELTNLQMKNRHYKMSVLNLVQAYKLCPRSIRLNSRVMMMFPCKSEKMIKEFADTASSQYTPDEFLKLFEYATKDKPYDFLYIDVAEPKGFRKNFNERLDIIGGEKDDEEPAPETVEKLDIKNNLSK